MLEDTKHKHIVFYDGDCGFCNSSVQFILEKRKKDIYFLPLQAENSKELLAGYQVTINMDTIYFLSNKKLYNRSSAALRISRLLKFPYPLLFGFYIVPKFIRDVFYNAIAKRRHKIRASYCVKPLKEEEQFFLN